MTFRFLIRSITWSPNSQVIFPSLSALGFTNAPNEQIQRILIFHNESESTCPPSSGSATAKFIILFRILPNKVQLKKEGIRGGSRIYG